MASSVQTARIEAVRDLPLVMTINDAAESARANSRGTVLRTALGLILGGMAGILLAFVRDAFRRTGDETRPAERELRDLSREVLDDIRRPLRMLPFTRARRGGKVVGSQGRPE